MVCDCLLVEKIAGYGPSRAWQLTLALGVVSWSAGNAVLALTHDPVLVPAVALVGSFVVPGTLLVALMEYVARRQDQTSSSIELPGPATELGPLRLMLAFLAGGALGLWPSILLEFVLEKASVFLYLPSVAVVEEAVQLAIVWMMALGIAVYRRRDGMILGASVGLGFAAFESFGYAYATAGSSLVPDLLVMQDQVTRALLSPFGHPAWMALVGGALFACANGSRLRLGRPVVLWFAVVVLLHLAWDASSGLSAAVVAADTGRALTVDGFINGTLSDLSSDQSWALRGVRLLLLVANAVVVSVLVVGQWRKAVAQDA